MNQLKIIVCLLLFIAPALHVPGQTRIIDSLKKRIGEASSDREKLNGISDLSEQAINADSLLPYILLAEQIAHKTNNKKDFDQAAYYRAIYYARKNIADSALEITDKLLSANREDSKNRSLYLKLLFFKAKILDRSNQYTKSLIQLMEVVTTAESLKDTLTQIQAKTGIGWVQMEMEQYREALQWLYKALYTSGNKKYYKNYGALYSNIATAYNALGNPDSAAYYIRIAIEDARENENSGFLATALSMEAKIFIDNGMPHLAEAPLHEVVEIRKKLNDPFYIVYDMSNLASYYANNNQPQKGIALCKEGIVIAKQRGLPSQLLMIYRALAENYKAAGNKEEYGQTLESIIGLKDSFNNINSSKMLAEMQAANETQKKEKIIEQKLKLTKKNYWLYGSILFALMVAVIGWLGFKNFRRRQRLKMEMALVEEKKLAALAVRDAGEYERKRIAADLHDNLGTYAASLYSNLSYIQPANTDAATINAFREMKNNSNAIISELNDTIWVLKKDALSLTAISDRVKNFINRIKKSYPEMDMDVEERIETDHQFSSSQAFHLYRVVQEGVNNSLKHSKGKNILVKITCKGSWNVSVEDDGIGWQTANTSAEGGNGLQNMKSRCKEAGWAVNWSPGQGGGTVVNISPTTN